MRHLFLALLLGCAASGPRPEAPAAGPQVPWKDMTQDQRADFMATVVMPKMKPLFQTFDPKTFQDFGCVTCHGEGAKNTTFAMPNPDIFVLPGDKPGFALLFKEKPDWMHFMQKQVVPAMTKLLDKPEFDSAHPDPNALGCFTCHTHKEA